MEQSDKKARRAQPLDAAGVFDLMHSADKITGLFDRALRSAGPGLSLPQALILRSLAGVGEAAEGGKVRIGKAALKRLVGQGLVVAGETDDAKPTLTEAGRAALAEIDGVVGTIAAHLGGGDKPFGAAQAKQLGRLQRELRRFNGAGKASVGAQHDVDTDDDEDDAA